MTGQQLRNSILQEAIHGRLVPNVLEPGEKTGAELLQQILKERQDRENKEKGKKAQQLSLSIIEDEPYEIPDEWCWCKIRDIADIERGGNFQKRDFVDSGYPCIHYGQIHMKLGPRTYTTLSYLSNELAAKQRKAHTGDIVMAVTSENIEDVCKCTAWLGEGDVAIGAHTAIIRHYINPVFLVYYFKSSLFYSQKKELGHGSKVVEVTPVTLNDVVLPLPPLSIQKAIVEKIEELLPLIDEYDKAAVELETLNKILPDKLRKSVLQEAIHGTLVSNDIPEGEATGAELLQQILKERQEKENKEKGKKAKKLTLSTIEEEPWELPEEWCWCKIGDIFDHSAGKSLNSSKQSIGKVYPYLTTSNVYYEGINFEKVKEMSFTEEEYKKCSAIKNDILVCEGGDVGRSCIWTYDYSIGLQNHVHRLRAIKDTDVKFVNYVLRFYKAAGIITAKGIGIGGFSANALKGLSIPLPPLSIQHRIVEKIEEVFSAIDKLQA